MMEVESFRKTTSLLYIPAELDGLTAMEETRKRRYSSYAVVSDTSKHVLGWY
jgi:hypothetical protein